MTERDRLDELTRRMLEGEDPDNLARSVGSSEDWSAALRALELLAASSGPLEPRAELRQGLVRSTDPREQIMGYVHRVASLFDVDAATARTLLASTRDVGSSDWFDDEIPGVRMRRVEPGPNASGANCLLIHMRPGVGYPTHRHLGDEWCLFLGGTGLEDGREWNPGDLVLNPAGSEHPLLEATSSEPFILAVTLREGMEFTNR